jgi:hypothetical protein
MKNQIEYYNLKRFITRKAIERYLIVLGSLILIYLLISLYFINHFFLNTRINNVNLSFKSYKAGEELLKTYADKYSLLLLEREGKMESLSGSDIKFKYNKNNSLKEVYRTQLSLKWVFTLFESHNYYVKDLFSYDLKALKGRVDQLNCLKGERILPGNVSFQYVEGQYKTMEEIKGDVLKLDRFQKLIQQSISAGKATLDLDKTNCYENPRYTLGSAKTEQTRKLLNKYVSTCITYIFGEKSELLDGSIINQWLSVDNNLDVEINTRFVRKYIQSLSKKYDTVGMTRNFKTSLGKIVEVKGGLYGFKINQEGETLAVIDHITGGQTLEKEPIYTQKAFGRDEKEIGDTYVEINITRQYLWFYKDGKLIAQGAVVTGNPNKGNATVVGTNMLNYKQKSVSLTGRGYEVGVTYWMPFYGNIGIHDAKWRSSFGGTIYKTRGTHGCVNAPIYLAKVIYENISEGIPIISYEEP